MIGGDIEDECDRCTHLRGDPTRRTHLQRMETGLQKKERSSAAMLGRMFVSYFVLAVVFSDPFILGMAIFLLSDKCWPYEGECYFGMALANVDLGHTPAFLRYRGDGC